MKVLTDNCQACGQEECTTELTLIKLNSTQNINVCASCLQIHLALEDYKEAARLIVLALEKP